MAVKISAKKRDAQVDRILRDPKAYFLRARESARAAVEADVARERRRMRRRPA